MLLIKGLKYKGGWSRSRFFNIPTGFCSWSDIKETAQF